MGSAATRLRCGGIFDHQFLTNTLLGNKMKECGEVMGKYSIVTYFYHTTVYAVVMCPSVTSRCSTETAKRRITQTTLKNTGTLCSFLTPKISAKFKRDHPNGVFKCRWGRLTLATVDNSL